MPCLDISQYHLKDMVVRKDKGKAERRDIDRGYHEAQKDYTQTHALLRYLGINVPFAQDICYTGLSGRNYSVRFCRLHKTLSVNAAITQEFSGT